MSYSKLLLDVTLDKTYISTPSDCQMALHITSICKFYQRIIFNKKVSNENFLFFNHHLWLSLGSSIDCFETLCPENPISWCKSLYMLAIHVIWEALLWSTPFHWEPQTHCTKDFSYFAFDGKLFLLLFPSSWLDHYKILHMPWQHSCHGMCKIVAMHQSEFRWHKIKFPSKLELWWRNHQWDGPQLFTESPGSFSNW